MTHAALSVLLFGVYMLGEGLILLIMPNFLLSIFGIPETHEVWVRVVGICLLVFAYYYIRSARINDVAFFRFTTQGRTLQFVLFIAVVLLANAPVVLIMFSAVELASGIWTFIALRGEKSA
ncbi:MAG: hypothetical protein KDK35_05035 [Leptospiraceae bacterium]|nr:hypothetical protein [Leptospiraceae bacterium]MCP5485905.1 hypothetical protein [Spirochaetales bacterium]